MHKREQRQRENTKGRDKWRRKREEGERCSKEKSDRVIEMGDRKS
jgi:hypothetical protein